MTSKTAPKTRLNAGESSVDRVADSLTGRGPFQADVSVRLWDERLKRFKIRAQTKGEFRRKGHVKCGDALAAGSSTWTKSDKVSAFIDNVSEPLLRSARLRDNSRRRYMTALAQIKTSLTGLPIGDAVRFRTLEHALQDIAARHGAESGRQARTVLSKYVLDQLLREGLVEHNPLRGVAIDLGTVSKSKKPASHALTDTDYDRVVDHLVARDIDRPLPPGTDRRESSLARHERAVALALLQAGTGLRISEALALTRADLTESDDRLAVPVSADVSKTHRARSIPFLDARVEAWHRARLVTLPTAGSTPIISAPGDLTRPWRTDNAVKASKALYLSVGADLGSEAVAAMRSHAWRTVLNNRAIARGVPADVRAAFFGHDVAMNASAYTDLTDIEGMARALRTE